MADLEGTTARDLVGEGLTSKANKETKISWTSFNIIFLSFKKAEKKKKYLIVDSNLKFTSIRMQVLDKDIRPT